MDAESIVRAELDAWQTLDVDRIMAPFAPDAVWEAGAADVFFGCAAIRNAVDAYLGRTTSGNIEIRHLAVAGNVVLTERIDHFVYDGRQIDARVMGTFEVAEGKITAWRDYFDASVP
jgi:limonene-1,2-epoxide hydrolase